MQQITPLSWHQKNISKVTMKSKALKGLKVFQQTVVEKMYNKKQVY